MRADEVYAILKGKIVKLTEDIKEVGDWKPIRHQGTVQTAEDLPADAKEGYMYNIATDSVYGAAGMNVVKTADGWDPMGPIVNMDLYLSKEEAKKGYQPAGDYLTENKAKETYQPVGNYSTKEETEKKLNKNQGIDNAGKITGINADGDIVPVFPTGVQYNEETNLLEFGTDPNMLNKGIQLDATLKKSGYAADSAAVGENIDSLKEDISTKITKFYASSQGETHLADSDNGKIQDMMIYGKSEQKQFSGKNLFDKSTSKSAWISDGGIYIEKGEIGENTDVVSTYIGVKENSTYIASFKTNYNTSLVYWCTYNANKEFASIIKNANKITIPTGIRYVRVMISLPQQYCVAVNDELQVELGTEATSYEPYVGGQPSPSPDYPQEIKSVVNPTVKVCGKNLFKATLGNVTANGITCTANSDGTYILNGTCTVSTALSIIGIFDHILNEPLYLTGVPSGCGSYLALGRRDGNNILVTDGKNTKIDAGIHTDHIEFWITKGTTLNNVIFKPMLTTDPTVTYDDFEPYHEQTVTLPYTLNAIPVNSGGNVTIDGQQYIADYVDVERGKLVRMVANNRLLSSYNWNTANEYYWGSVSATTNGKTPITADNSKKMCACKYLFASSTYDVMAKKSGIAINNIKQVVIGLNCFASVDDLKTFLANNDVRLVYPLEVPTEIDLTSEEVQAFKALATYYPVTNIFINSEQLDGYTVFNYPISMENGWNYVKQQIGDTRDYIYDMDARAQDTDLQAAEAYVNSEYAVALTELEV